MTRHVDTTRRALLHGRIRRPEPVLRPPWAINEQDFVDGCVRCDACVAACPESIIVRGAGGLPEVDFTLGGCTFCRACVDACPEPLFDDPATSRAWSHRVNIQQSCLAHRGVFCQSCRDACDAGAIRFDSIAGGVPVPRVAAEQCTGCGFCIDVCPAGAVSIEHDDEGRGAE